MERIKREGKKIHPSDGAGYNLNVSSLAVSINNYRVYPDGHPNDRKREKLTTFLLIILAY